MNRAKETFFAEFEIVCECIINCFNDIANRYNNPNPLYEEFHDENYSYLNNEEVLFVIDLGLFAFERSMHLTYHSHL